MNEKTIRLGLQFFAEEDDGLFDDYSDTPTEEVEETVTEETQTETPAEPISAPTEPAFVEPPKIKVKYNGKDIDLTMDEAIKHAQKGMNYDHVKSELDTTKKQLEEIASAYGLPTNELMRQLKVNQLMQKDGYTQDIAEKLVNAELLAEEGKRIKLEQDKITQEQTKKDEDYQKNLSDFIRKYPDVKPESVPKDVWDEVNNGETLTSAYRNYENKLLKAKIQAFEQNQENQKKSPGSAKGNAPTEAEDIFLKALFG